MNGAPGSPAADRLLTGLRRRGLQPVGERSCKLRQGEILAERFLLGVPVAELTPADFLTLLTEFGMDSRGQTLFRHHFPGASEVQFAVEVEGELTRCKAYLEYWEALLRRLQRGETGPALLNLGFKWPEGRPDELELDRYLCLPKISQAAIIDRVRSRSGELGEAVAGLVARAAAGVPDGELVYLEVDGDSGGRHSYDINLYPCKRRLIDAAPCIRNIAGALSCDSDQLNELLERFAGAPLGHISGGCDRHGRGFFTFYYAVGRL